MTTTSTRETIRLVNPEDNGRALFILRNGDTVKLFGSRRTDDCGTALETTVFPYETEDEAADIVARLVKAFVAGGLYVGFRR